MKQMMAMLILTLLVSAVRAEIFRDDFNHGALEGWMFMLGAKNGGIQNGELVLNSPKPEREAEVIIAVDGIIASDYEVAVSVKISDFFREILTVVHPLGCALTHLRSLSRLLNLILRWGTNGFCTSKLTSFS